MLFLLFDHHCVKVALGTTLICPGCCCRRAVYSLGLVCVHTDSAYLTSTDLRGSTSQTLCLSSVTAPMSQPCSLIHHSLHEPTLLTPFPPSFPRRHQSDGNEIAHTRLRASTRDLRASPKPTSKSTIEEDLKKLIDLESPTPESQKNFKVEGPSLHVSHMSHLPSGLHAPLC